jgi:hypothetical protein
MPLPENKEVESMPEGRGCLIVSLVAVFLALLVFAVASWISAPSATPDPTAAGPAGADQDNPRP